MRVSATGRLTKSLGLEVLQGGEADDFLDTIIGRANAWYVG